MSEASQNESYAIPSIGTFAIARGLCGATNFHTVTLNGVGLGLHAVDRTECRRLIFKYVCRLLIERQGKLSDELWEVGQTLGELSSDPWNLGTFRVRRQP